MSQIVLAAVAVLSASALFATESDAKRMSAEAMNPKGAKPPGLERAEGNPFRVLIYGNSIALHGPLQSIGWTNLWGMAASALEKDFAHLVVAGLEKRRGQRADFRIRNLAGLERNFRVDLSKNRELAADVEYAPDYVVIAIGENVPAIDGQSAPDYRKFLADLARPLVQSAKRPLVVMRSPFWRNAAKAECTAGAAKDVGAIYVDASALGDKSENKAIGLFKHVGVANHPGDLGMKRLADIILAGFDSVAPQKEKWPLVVIRHTSGMNRHPETFGKLIESHRRYRGACDEFWFATGARETPEALEQVCASFARYRPLCEEVGILPSFQQGLTLGHGASHDGTPKPEEQQFPDDAWQRNRKGERIGFLCPRSPFVLDYERMYAKTVLRVANPSSYWLDDDLRLGISKEEGCFCDRCIAAFNAKTGGKWTRGSLAERLFSGKEREAVRAAWIDFNAESLAIYAKEVRKAADELKSPCRLAYQSVWADMLYTASSYRPLLEALAGNERAQTGIRPGAGFYVEAQPREMVHKCLSVAREAERCRGYGGLVGTVCYEQDTYPRHVLHKSPGAIMTESALAMASGCDSISLYWYAGEAPEPLEEYDRFVRTLAEARPYFERLSASVRRTRLGGVARFVGSAANEVRGLNLQDATDFHLACAGIPVTVAESGTRIWYETEKSRAEMTDADKARKADGCVVHVGDMGQFPLASRRLKLLDDLDAASGGNFPVRIDACRPLRILPRVRADGMLDSVTILNLSIGGTDELRVRVRNPVSQNAILQGTKGKPTPMALQKGAAENERVAVIPDLEGWQIATIFF